jgi:hypothetical protein
LTTPREYLVAIGAAGILGRFVARPSVQVVRGDEVVVKTDRGLERGIVLRQVDADEGQLAYRPPPGELLRPLGSADRRRLEDLTLELNDLFDQARQVASELALPLEIVDAEPVLEPRGFVFHLLRLAEVDLRPWTSRLSTSASAYVYIQDLTNPAALHAGHGCGTCGQGGCGNCGSEGGCGSGGCGSGCSTGNREDFERDWKAYFAELREQMGRRVQLPM